MQQMKPLWKIIAEYLGMCHGSDEEVSRQCTNGSTLSQKIYFSDTHALSKYCNTCNGNYGEKNVTVYPLCSIWGENYLTFGAHAPSYTE